MNRKAFLLGAFSISGQILLLREVVSSLHGDELFIGISMFGWMIAVAIGAVMGGKINLRSEIVFIFGILCLPLTLIFIRLSPLLYTSIPGAYIPFYFSVLIALAGVAPVGFISGFLFTLITNEGHRPAASIARVYLVEGIGAFVGGLLVYLLVGRYLSSIPLAVIIGCLILTLLFIRRRRATIFRWAVLLVAAVIIAVKIIPSLDARIDTLKYKGFGIGASFDTRYTHQAIINRDSSRVLLTDNRIEAVSPDIYSIEDQLIPPLVYLDKKDDIKALIFNRPEFGLSEIADSLGVSLYLFDPRKNLNRNLSDSAEIKNVKLYQRDYLSSMTDGSDLAIPLINYDLISLKPGGIDQYKINRYFTYENISRMKNRLNRKGIFAAVLSIDTDRHINDEKAELLSIILSTFKMAFNNVHLWPGEETILLGSDNVPFDLDYDTIITRIDSLPYSPEFINKDYLYDRLNEFKYENVYSVLDSTAPINSLNKPLLVKKQIVADARLNDADFAIVKTLFNNRAGVYILGSLLFVFWVFTLFSRRKRRSYALFIYFVAGLVSLSIEMIVFYYYQSTAGSLFTEMALMIGTFMLGMALGTYFSCILNKENLEIPALLLLLTSTVVYFNSYQTLAVDLRFLYSLLFIFSTALATGSMFVAATDRYYYGKSGANRGVGYAFEIGGSSLGALLTLTILLPIIGLHWLMISIIVLLALTLIGAIVTVNR